MRKPLRIALSCQQDTAPLPLPAYRFWADYFRKACGEAGHEIIECPDCAWAEGLLPLDRDARLAWRERTWRKYVSWLATEHRRRPVDVALSYLFPNQIEPAALKEISSLGLPTVNFFCDNVREFREVPVTFQGFDLHWVPEWKALAMYQRAGLPHLHAPMPCWVGPSFRGPVKRERSRPVFVGTRDDLRDALLSEAVRLGLDLEVSGTGWLKPTSRGAASARSRNPVELTRRQLEFARKNGWQALWRKWCGHRANEAHDFTAHARPSPIGDDYWAALRESVVCIGVNRYPSLRHPANKPDTYSRLRDIEAPMAGACYLTECTEGLDRMYELGVEIEAYRNAPELVEKARRLSADATRRRALRSAGQARALRDHTIARTLERIAHQLGI